MVDKALTSQDRFNLSVLELAFAKGMELGIHIPRQLIECSDHAPPAIRYVIPRDQQKRFLEACYLP